MLAKMSHVLNIFPGFNLKKMSPKLKRLEKAVLDRWTSTKYVV